MSADQLLRGGRRLHIVFGAEQVPQALVDSERAGHVALFRSRAHLRSACLLVRGIEIEDRLCQLQLACVVRALIVQPVFQPADNSVVQDLPLGAQPVLKRGIEVLVARKQSFAQARSAEQHRMRAMLDLGGVQNGVHVQLQRASVDLDGQLFGRQALVAAVSKLPPQLIEGLAKRYAGIALRNIAPELPGQLISRARRALDRQKCQKPLCLPASQLDLVAGAIDAHAAEHGHRKQRASSWFSAHVGAHGVTHQHHSAQRLLTSSTSGL